jgi:hypothetical protein
MIIPIPKEYDGLFDRIEMLRHVGWSPGGGTWTDSTRVLVAFADSDLYRDGCKVTSGYDSDLMAIIDGFAKRRTAFLQKRKAKAVK